MTNPQRKKSTNENHVQLSEEELREINKQKDKKEVLFNQKILKVRT